MQLRGGEGNYVSYTRACRNEWICHQDNRRSRLVPSEEVFAEKDDLTAKLVLLSKRDTLTSSLKGLAGKVSPGDVALPVDPEALVTFAAQIVTLASNTSTGAVTPLAVRQANKVVLTPPTWWPQVAATPKQLVSPSRVVPIKSFEQAALTSVRLAVNLGVDIPCEAIRAIDSSADVRTHIILWLLKNDDKLRHVLNTPLLSKLLRGGVKDDELVQRLIRVRCVSLKMQRWGKNS